MRAKTVLLLFLIAALLIGGCDSDEAPPEPPRPDKPSATPPTPPPPPGTEAAPVSAPVAKPTAGSPIAQEAPDGTSIQIVEGKENGEFLATLPIYHSGDMRYFAAGIGRLERTAKYPKFPVKLIFSGSDGAYLSFVAVTVWAKDGTQVWQIPASHVKGPWVFLDLKAGNYRIDAVKGADTKTHAKVEVTTGKQQTVFFTWP